MSLPISEERLQDTVIEWARALGYHVHHSRPARTEHGWRTPIQGDKGFPDVVAAIEPGIVYALELKSAHGRLTEEQAQWAAALGGGERVRLGWRLVRPNNLDAVLSELEMTARGLRR